MKKIYEQPTLAIESFVTEEVMAETNAFASRTYTLDGTEWNFLTVGEGKMDNVLNSVTYSDFE